MQNRVSKKIFIVLLVISVSLVLVHLLLQYLNIVIHFQQVGHIYELSNRFDLDDESSVPTWFSQFLFLLMAGLAALAAYLQKDKTSKSAWSIIALIGLIFSIDEVATLHEYVLETVHVVLFQDESASVLANSWLVVTPILVVLFIWFVWIMLKALPLRSAVIFAIAGAAMIFGAAFIEMISVAVDEESFMNQGVLVALEEGLEVLAAIIIVYAICEYLETKHNKALSRAFKELKHGKA